MGLLVVFGRSPWAADWGFVLDVTKRIVGKGEKVSVLHVQDACIAVTMSEYCEKLGDSHVEVYALRVDCEARGLVEKVSGKVKLVDYRQWVRLVMDEHDRIVSWTS